MKHCSSSSSSIYLSPSIYRAGKHHTEQTLQFYIALGERSRRRMCARVRLRLYIVLYSWCVELQYRVVQLLICDVGVVIINAVGVWSLKPMDERTNERPNGGQNFHRTQQSCEQDVLCVLHSKHTCAFV